MLVKLSSNKRTRLIYLSNEREKRSREGFDYQSSFNYSLRYIALLILLLLLLEEEEKNASLLSFEIKIYIYIYKNEKIRLLLSYTCHSSQQTIYWYNV